jgi:hypothetical protein
MSVWVDWVFRLYIPGRIKKGHYLPISRTDGGQCKELILNLAEPTLMDPATINIL